MAYKKQKNVNIDALIAREDFEAADETTNTASKISTLSVNDLKEGSGLFLASVRKPDFQRETADWDIDKIVRFIKSFVDGEFIPAVILWRSQAGLIFVIDGSHRLSSLIAWVNEVYIQEAYKKAPRCAICGGLLHTHSISIDHIQRKRDGGLGCVENGQLTHPYCNTGVKN